MPKNNSRTDEYDLDVPIQVPLDSDSVAEGSARSSTRDDLLSELVIELESRLVFTKLNRELGYRGIEQICKATSSSREQIADWCRQTENFVRTIIETAVDVDDSMVVTSSFVHEQRTALVHDLLVEVSFPKPPLPIVDFRFADLPPDQAFETARKTLRKECVNFSMSFLELLSELQTRLVVGQVEHARTTCKLVFYRHKLTFAKDGEAVTRDIRDVSQRPSARGNLLHIFRDQSIIATRATEAHTHHVHHPVRRKLGLERHTIPKRFRALLEAAPNWIAPHIDILEGTQINEMQSIEETNTQQHVDRVHISSQWQLDPAIVLGRFVLAGWNEVEIRRESATEQGAKAKGVGRKMVWMSNAWFVAAGLLVLFSVLLMALSYQQTSVLPVAAVVVGLAALAAVSQGLSLREDDPVLANPVGSARWRLVTQAVFAEALFAVHAFTVSIAHRSWFALAVGVICSALAVCTLWVWTIVESVRDSENVQ